MGNKIKYKLTKKQAKNRSLVHQRKRCVVETEEPYQYIGSENKGNSHLISQAILYFENRAVKRELEILVYI